MAKFEQKANIELQVTMTLSESEARALSVLCSYGTAAVQKKISELVGSSDCAKHKQGFESFLESCREIDPILARVNDARAVFLGRATVNRNG